MLEESKKEGGVHKKPNDGEDLVVERTECRSPLDIQGIDVAISREEIVESVRESRERG